MDKLKIAGLIRKWLNNNFTDSIVCQVLAGIERRDAEEFNLVLIGLVKGDYMVADLEGIPGKKLGTLVVVDGAD
jgi:hypothetical protein